MPRRPWRVRTVAVCSHAYSPPSTRRARVPLRQSGRQAWFALMNPKSPTASCRSPERTRPRLLTEISRSSRNCLFSRRSRVNSLTLGRGKGPAHLRPGGPRCRSAWRHPLANGVAARLKLAGRASVDYGQHGPGRPSVGEIPANTVGRVFWHLWQPPLQSFEGVHQTGSTPTAAASGWLRPRSHRCTRAR